MKPKHERLLDRKVLKIHRFLYWDTTYIIASQRNSSLWFVTKVCISNKQITTCDTNTTQEPHECSANCSSCDKLLPIAKAQLHMTSLVLQRLDDVCDSQPEVPPTHSHYPRDCSEVQAAGFNDSGRYAIYPDDNQDPFFVFCDMETAGGGWTVSISSLVASLAAEDIIRASSPTPCKSCSTKLIGTIHCVYDSWCSLKDP